jgi:hypothetical protein
VDYVRGGEGRLKRLSIDKGLLREAESVQEQIRYLLKCQVQPRYMKQTASADLVYCSLLTMSQRTRLP